MKYYNHDVNIYVSHSFIMYLFVEVEKDSIVNFQTYTNATRQEHMSFYGKTFNPK